MQKIRNKKEWVIIRYIKKNINVDFICDSNKMLNGRSKKRSDMYVELDKHCIVIEIDEKST